MALERLARRPRRDAEAIHQIPWRQPVNRLPPVEVLSADQVEAIHNASLRVLEEIGMEVLNHRALALFRRAGATVDIDAQRVRLDRGSWRKRWPRRPRRSGCTPATPAETFIYGDPYLTFACVGGPPNCSDLDGGRRPGNHRDSQNFIRLQQSLNAVHLVGPAVAAIDLDAETRHLNSTYDLLTLSDRAFHASGLGPTRIADALEMV